uniref:Uncharacterized protein n=1 Tax=Knipowitschia caucasica TaxID=637954 RepID=A0AAV2LXL7_KNICA
MDWNELQNRVLSQERDLMSAYRDAQAARVMEVHKAQDLHMARVTRQADHLLSRQHARANAVMHRSERSVDSCISEQSRSSPWTPPFAPPPLPTSR